MNTPAADSSASGTTGTPDLGANLALVRNDIQRFCSQYNRPVESVSLLAVSKTQPAAAVSCLLAEGQQDFGENYLQEAVTKIHALQAHEAMPTWHYIGAIQTNKTRAIAEHFAWVHTVASTKVARRLANQRPAHLPPLNLLVQVNIDAEASKAGVSPSELTPLIESILPLSGVRLRGLMAIPANRTDLESQRQPFRAMRQLLQDLQQRYGTDAPALDQLSMGMSGDMEAAIAEGSTWVRIGTAIFGPRTPVATDP